MIKGSMFTTRLASFTLLSIFLICLAMVWVSSVLELTWTVLFTSILGCFVNSSLFLCISVLELDPAVFMVSFRILLEAFCYTPQFGVTLQFLSSTSCTSHACDFLKDAVKNSRDGEKSRFSAKIFKTLTYSISTSFKDTTMIHGANRIYLFVEISWRALYERARTCARTARSYS